PHADHIGGLIEVLEVFEVKEVWHNGDTHTSKTYQQFMESAEAEGAEVRSASLHDVIEAGELSFYVHHPAAIVESTNNNSIVLHLQYGEIDFLFTGDAEEEAEGQMMMLSSVRVPEVEILKVGHHASRTASSLDFLQITSPEVAIYMCKEDNSYGHPHEETITKLTDIGTEIYGTDVYGTIAVSTDGLDYTVEVEGAD
ncbi:MAG: MBL fold metallo-hydrolase, partial [Planctomycetes bacterium]|nr:MBL fold metallo-hydrolase [Planctomycetota bacterium]